MDIRTKLVFTLVAVALSSMLAIGAFSYRSARALILNLRLAQLDGLAETRRDALEELFESWRDRARLIASRTQLRASLDDHNRDHDAESRQIIERILTDALRSVTAVRQLGVYGWDDKLVASVGTPGARAMPDSLPQRVGPASTSMFQSATVAEDGEIRLTFLAAMRLDDVAIGTLQMVFEPEELADLAANHRGLGRTGETMIFMDDDRGRLRVLHPLRHQADADDHSDAFGEALLATALTQSDGVLTGSFRDYRGEPVWAATRYVEESGWGLVVKMDADEHLEPIHELRRETTELGISLAAFAILLGTILGLQFARPIHQLAAAADQISDGRLETRVPVKGQDEVAALSRTFNQMAEGLERRVADLREFKSFFDLSIDLLCIADTDGYFKRINPAFDRVLGWNADQLLGRPFVDFVHPDDVESTIAEVARLAEGKPTVSFQNRYRRSDGVYIELLWTSYPDPETGRIYAIARVAPEGSRRG